MEYFKEALAYQISADRLLALIAPQPRIGLPLSDPIYFLYHHAAELALQACLLAHNLLQEGVRALIVDIEPHLRAWGHNKGVAGPWDPDTVTRLRYALGKPTYTKQPKPQKPGP